MNDKREFILSRLRNLKLARKKLNILIKFMEDSLGCEPKDACKKGKRCLTHEEV